MIFVRRALRLNVVDSLLGREVTSSDSDRQGSNSESFVWREVSSHSSHHLQEVLQTQFSQYGHRGGLKPYSFFSHVLNINLGS